jgi:hypothetical protein
MATPSDRRNEQRVKKAALLSTGQEPEHPDPQGIGERQQLVENDNGGENPSPYCEPREVPRNDIANRQGGNNAHELQMLKIVVRGKSGARHSGQREYRSEPAVKEPRSEMSGARRNDGRMKRVIGVPGDNIRLNAGVLIRNGNAVIEPYVVRNGSALSRQLPRCCTSRSRWAHAPMAVGAKFSYSEW